MKSCEQEETQDEDDERRRKRRRKKNNDWKEWVRATHTHTHFQQRRGIDCNNDICRYKYISWWSSFKVGIWICIWGVDGWGGGDSFGEYAANTKSILWICFHSYNRRINGYSISACCCGGCRCHAAAKRENSTTQRYEMCVSLELRI